MKKFTIFIGAILLFASCFAAGPTGFGPIKIGLTKAEVESIDKQESIKLNAPMTEAKTSTTKPSEERFKAFIESPFSSKPLESFLTFENGKLIDITIYPSENSYISEKFIEEISKKYGEPKIENKIKEEQCIYKNGSNFKLSSGTISHDWTQETNATNQIHTQLYKINMNTCPQKLNQPNMNIGWFNIFRITLENKSEQPKTTNTF